MFDLNIIEKEWANSYKALSEDEIYRIFRSEKATYEDYLREYKEWKKTTTTSSNDLRGVISFGNKGIVKKLNEEKELQEELPEPLPKRLSEEKQKEVILGSMNILFDSVKGCFKTYGDRVDMETLYDICLEGLIMGINTCTCKRGEFRNFIETCIYNRVHGYLRSLPEEIEIPTNPSAIYYMTMNDSYEIDYLESVSLNDPPKMLIKK